MQKSNELGPGPSNSVSSQLGSKKSDRPPLQKRSKTISDETHFPGPLFPTVRRSLSSLPTVRTSDLRVSVDSEDDLTQSRSSSSRSSSVSGGFSYGERDWMYPSFLGPHMGRSRVTVKANKTQKSGGGVQGKGVVGEKQRIQSLLKEEKKVDSVVNQPSFVSQSSGGTKALKSSLMFYLVSTFYFIVFAIFGEFCLVITYYYLLLYACVLCR